ncbi:MAG: hypothetical protein G01um10147_109 [Microgenomates group bacterium Gr01-1014_7]|nr:MAG: hypothetical protein G01um10147_109 [Microgenomates group bacterium Gr01-1014_7]
MIDREQRLGVLIPDGKHILRPVLDELNRRGFHSSSQRRNGHLLVEVEDPDVVFIAQSSRDITRLVDEGIYPLGIVASDRRAEYLALASLHENDPSPNLEELAVLEVFNPNVRLSVLVRNNYRYQIVTDLEHQRVITSYPGLTMQFFEQHFPKYDGVPINLDGRTNGKEEVQVSDHRAEAAVVIVDSGKTMRTWSLRELAVVKDNIQPVLIGNTNFLQSRGSESLFEQFEQFMDRFQNGERSDISLPSTPTLLPTLV